MPPGDRLDARPRLALAVCGSLLLAAAPAAFAQTNAQLQGNLTLDWVKTDRLVYEFDIEPEAFTFALVSDRYDARKALVRELSMFAVGYHTAIAGSSRSRIMSFLDGGMDE